MSQETPSVAIPERHILRDHARDSPWLVDRHGEQGSLDGNVSPTSSRPLHDDMASIEYDEISQTGQSLDPLISRPPYAAPVPNLLEPPVPGMSMASTRHLKREPFRSLSVPSLRASTLTPPLSHPAGRSSFATTNGDRVPQHVRDTLVRLAQIRMRVLEQRTAAKEEGTHMRNLNKQLIKELYHFLDSVKSINPPVITNAQQLSDWDDCLVNIEDYLEESNAAGRKFDQKQQNLIELEWELRKQELELSNEPTGIENAGHGDDQNHGHAADDTLLRRHSDALSHHGLEPFAEDIEHFLSLIRTSEDNADLKAFSPSDSSEHAPEVMAVTTPRSSGDSFDHVTFDPAKDEDFDQHYGPSGDDLSQFMNVDVPALIEQARKASLVLSPAYSQSDLDRFFRWLAYGKPWNDRLGSTREELPLPPSVLSTFRTWIWHSLELLSLGIPASTHLPHMRNLDKLTFAELRRVLAQNWLWDPWVRSKPKDRTSQQQPEIPSSVPPIHDSTPQPPDSVFSLLTTSEQTLTSNGDTAAIGNVHAQQSPLKANDEFANQFENAVSKQSAPYINKDDFLARRPPSNRRASTT